MVLEISIANFKLKLVQEPLYYYKYQSIMDNALKLVDLYFIIYLEYESILVRPGGGASLFQRY